MKIFLHLLITLLSYNLLAQNINDDFESYPVGFDITKNTLFSNIDNNSIISDKKARSGTKSLKIYNISSTRTKILNYENHTGFIDISFQLYIEGNNQVEISPQNIFPFFRFLSEGKVVSLLKTENLGILNFEHNKWIPVRIVGNINDEQWKFYVNNELLDMNNYSQIYNSALTINTSNKNLNIYIDDLIVKFEENLNPKVDVAINSVEVKRYEMTYIEDSLVVSLYNKGSSLINDIIIDYKINNDSFSREFNNLNFLPFSISYFKLKDKISLLPGKNIFKVKVRLLNDSELNLENNEIEITSQGFELGNKRPLFEYQVAPQDGDSPICFIAEREVSKKYGNFINTAFLHYSGPMKPDNYNYVGSYGIELFINKIASQFIIPYEFRIIDELKNQSDIELSNKILLNKSTGNMVVETDAKFLNSFNDIAYFSYLILEDSVKGNNSNYNQYNSSQFNSIFYDMKEFTDLPEVIPYDKFYHRKVVRYALNGIYGKKISPLSGGIGDVIKLTEQIPFTFNKLNKHYSIISILMDRNRNIINTSKSRMIDIIDEVSSAEELNPKISIYPNPASKYIKISGIEDADYISIKSIENKSIIDIPFSKELEIGHLINGPYFMTIGKNKKEYHFKFIKVD